MKAVEHRIFKTFFCIIAVVFNDNSNYGEKCDCCQQFKLLTLVQ